MTQSVWLIWQSSLIITLPCNCVLLLFHMSYTCIISRMTTSFSNVQDIEPTFIYTSRKRSEWTSWTAARHQKEETLLHTIGATSTWICNMKCHQIVMSPLWNYSVTVAANNLVVVGSKWRWSMRTRLTMASPQGKYHSLSSLESNPRCQCVENEHFLLVICSDDAAIVEYLDEEHGGYKSTQVDNVAAPASTFVEKLSRLLVLHDFQDAEVISSILSHDYMTFQGTSSWSQFSCFCKESASRIR